MPSNLTKNYLRIAWLHNCVDFQLYLWKSSAKQLGSKLSEDSQTYPNKYLTLRAAREKRELLISVEFDPLEREEGTRSLSEFRDSRTADCFAKANAFAACPRKIPAHIPHIILEERFRIETV